MSDETQLITYELSDELVYIYITLRKLKYLSRGEYSLFPQAFLLKLLNERLDKLHELAGDICDDLFKQVVGGVDQAGNDEVDVVIDIHNKSNKYPEFDEYFHMCLDQLYDFILDLHWHHELPSPAEAAWNEQSTPNLHHMEKFAAFQRTMSDSMRKVMKTKAKLSPTARRRVQFNNPPPPTELLANKEDSPTINQPDAAQPNNQDLLDNHSVYALDLLLFSIDIFSRRLMDSLDSWSSTIKIDLNQQIDILFETKTKMRSKQLQIIAKKIKIFNDVHLTILDHLKEIKHKYLIKIIRGTLLARDSFPLLENYKNPRITYYSQHIGDDAEVKILKRLVSQCLQILFNLIVCEINVPPIELRGGGKDDLIGIQANVMNFVSNWLKVDDILFGVAQHKKKQTSKMGNDQINRPRIVAKTSTLSLRGNYKSSSRILTQMDNLSEFTYEFMNTIVDRLDENQHLGFFLQSVSQGFEQFSDIVAARLKGQMEASSSPKSSDPDLDINLATAKIRYLKFVHILSLVKRI